MRDASKKKLFAVTGYIDRSLADWVAEQKQETGLTESAIVGLGLFQLKESSMLKTGKPQS